MKIQYDWLKQYVNCSLPADELGHLLTMAGLEIESQEQVALADGATTDVLELNVTPNRGYCLSYLGVAGEVSALTGSPLNRTDPTAELEQGERGDSIEDKLTVSLEASDLCPRYSALVIEGVKVGPSPKWLADRLTSIGLRPINNVVDITNFVLMEYGQPLHAFDLDLLKQNQIIIRKARSGEPFTALDGTELKLEQDALVIADTERPVALAGVMGGANSQVTDTTVNIALESALFDASSIRKTSKKYGLRSDSSYRFERGVDMDGVITAQARAALLIQELAGGIVAEGTIDCYPSPQPPVKIDFRVKRCNRILGTDLSKELTHKYLVALGMTIGQHTDDRFELTVPSSRPLLTREIDLIEEVARLHSYSNIEVTDPQATLKPIRSNRLQSTSQRARDFFVGKGFTEAINYSFLEEDVTREFINAFAEDDAQTIPLDNPISLDLGTMRTSLLPGLIKSAVRNINRGQKSLALFELGKAFFVDKKGTRVERPCLSAVVTGPLQQNVWTTSGDSYGFFDLKGPLEALLAHLKIEGVFETTGKPYFAQGPSAECQVSGNSIAVLGELEPRLARTLDLDQPLFGLEIDLQALTEAVPDTVRFETLPKFPATYRDISILVGKTVTSQQACEVVQQTSGPLLKQVALYDQFEGKKLGADIKSLTFALTFQSPDRTLTDDEVNPVFEKIVGQLSEQLGARLRD